MAVSNPPSLSSVYAEFGAPAGTGLSAFLRGGAWVPNGPAANAGVPTSLPISLSQLAGAIKNNFNATVSPLSVFGSRNTTGIASSTSSTCTATGQTGTVTYSWSVTTTGGLTVTAVSPTAQTTAFQATVNNLNPDAFATATCTVHDSGSGLNATAGTVNIHLQYTGP